MLLVRASLRGSSGWEEKARRVLVGERSRRTGSLDRVGDREGDREWRNVARTLADEERRGGLMVGLVNTIVPVTDRRAFNLWWRDRLPPLQADVSLSQTNQHAAG